MISEGTADLPKAGVRVDPESAPPVVATLYMNLEEKLVASFFGKVAL